MNRAIWSAAEVATVARLVEAALDQPEPTLALVDALQRILTETQHPDRLRSLDFQLPGRHP